MLNADPPLRRRGCQPPLSMVQIVTAALYLALTALVFVAIALCASSQAQAFLYPVHGALVALTVLCYLVCSCCDVTLPGGVPCVCVATSQATQHWDRQSGGIVPGFDHYCVFIGAAVGRRTYFFFYILALCGLLQFSWQVASMAAVAAGPWLGAPGQGSALSQPSKQAFAGVVSFLGLAGVVSFGPLCFFHTYLLTQGLSTYHWLVRRSELLTARHARERAAADAGHLAVRSAAEAPLTIAAPPAEQPRHSPGASFVTAISGSTRSAGGGGGGSTRSAGGGGGSTRSAGGGGGSTRSAGGGGGSTRSTGGGGGGGSGSSSSSSASGDALAAAASPALPPAYSPDAEAARARGAQLAAALAPAT